MGVPTAQQNRVMWIPALWIMSDLTRLNEQLNKTTVITRDFTFPEVAVTPLFFIWLSCIQVVLALLGAGATHVQNDVLLGVHPDKISALKGQMTSWEVDRWKAAYSKIGMLLILLKFLLLVQNIQVALKTKQKNFNLASSYLTN